LDTAPANPATSAGTVQIGPQRAPDEMTGPVLRVSPHLDATVDDLEALAAAL
jgi:pyridoxal 5-phosphate dependent beta-lyase